MDISSAVLNIEREEKYQKDQLIFVKVETSCDRWNDQGVREAVA